MNSRRPIDSLNFCEVRIMNNTCLSSTIFPLYGRAALGLLFCAALGAHPTIASATPAQSTVDITKFAFTPTEITITPGAKIIWINHDETPHSVAGDDKSFASKGLDTEDKFEHTFASEGDFVYSCTLHPFMKGVVHVRKQ
jgi:plastocyanin